MIQRFLAAWLLLCVTCVMAGPSFIYFEDAAVSTNETAGAGDSHTNAVISSDYLDAIYLDFGGYASPTVDVDVVTVGGTGGMPSRTLFSINDVAADGIYYPRDIVDTTAGVDIPNTPVRIPLLHDHIAIRAYASESGTNIVSLKVYVITATEP